MRQVLARRDDNWKKLQQYVLDEREHDRAARTGPRSRSGASGATTPGIIRDGFFVRSPVKFNGVDDRRRRAPEVRSRLPAARQQERDKRAPARPMAAIGHRRWSANRRTTIRGRPMPCRRRRRRPDQADARSREFISSAYFLRFKFEEGKYALVGRETLDGRDVLRIEYYPTQAVRRQRPPAQRPRAVGPTTSAATRSSSG